MEDTHALGAAVVAKQVAVGLVAVLGAVCSGGSLAFSAVALPQLQADHDHLDADQASWFASLSSMSTPLGCVVCGLLLDRLGRRSLLLLLDAPFLAGWLLLALCPHPANTHAAQLYAGRLLTGFATGLASVPATVYLGETAPARLRATFVTWTSLSISAGILLAYALGAALPWRAAAGAWAALPAAALLLTWLLLPESPAWLARRGRHREAEAALRRLRAQGKHGPLPPAVAAELDVLRALGHTPPTKRPSRALDTGCHSANTLTEDIRHGTEPKGDGTEYSPDVQHKADHSIKLVSPESGSIQNTPSFGHSNLAFEEDSFASPVSDRALQSTLCVPDKSEVVNSQTVLSTRHESEDKRPFSCGGMGPTEKQPPATTAVCHVQGNGHLPSSLPPKSCASVSQEESKVADEVCETTSRCKLVTVLSRTWLLLCDPAVWRPLLILNTYFLFMQLAGVYVVVSYAVDIVTDAGVVIDPYVATIMLGGVQLVSSLVVSYIVTRCGRRPLSIISGAGMMLCMLGLSIYLQLADLCATNESTVTLLPLILLVLYVVFGALGFHTLPWALLGEVFPAHARGPAAGATTCLAYLANFAALKLYPSLASALTTDRGDGEWTSRDVFLFFAATSLAGTIFVALLLPETFRRSLQEIENNFRHGNFLQVCVPTPKKQNDEVFKGV